MGHELRRLSLLSGAVRVKVTAAGDFSKEDVANG